MRLHSYKRCIEGWSRIPDSGDESYNHSHLAPWGHTETYDLESRTSEPVSSRYAAPEDFLIIRSRSGPEETKGWFRSMD